MIDLVRGKDVNEAYAILGATPRRASRLVEKTLRSAVSNALTSEEGSDLAADSVEPFFLRAGRPEEGKQAGEEDEGRSSGGHPLKKGRGILHEVTKEALKPKEDVQ